MRELRHNGGMNMIGGGVDGHAIAYGTTVEMIPYAFISHNRSGYSSPTLRFSL